MWWGPWVLALLFDGGCGDMHTVVGLLVRALLASMVMLVRW